MKRRGIFLTVIPFLFLFARALSNSENWHYAFELFSLYGATTLLVALGACILAFTVSFPIAYYFSLYDFPFKKFFRTALILPITIPAYIGAYAYYKVFDFSGPINSFFRNTLNIPQIISSDLFSLYGAMFIFGIFLYPYLLLLLLSFMGKNAGEIDAVGRTLGSSRRSTIFRLILPLIKNPVFAGLLMISMEIFSDFGVGVYLGVPTLAAGIYKVWTGMDDISLATKIATISLPALFFLFWILNKIIGRHPIHYHASQNFPLVRLKGFALLGVLSLLIIVLSLGFIIPVGILIFYSFQATSLEWVGMIKDALPSTLLAAFATLLILVLGLFFASISRKKDNIFTEVFSLQYSIPSTLTALSVIIFAGFLGRFVPSALPVMRESFFLVLYAYVIRFIYLGYGAANGAFIKIGNSYKEVAGSLGANPVKAFFKIEFPLIFPALKMAFLYTFIDVFKELPLTLFLRPFNFSNLAVRTYTLMGDEMFAEGSPYALCLILILSLLIIIVLSYKEKKHVNSR